MPLNTLDSQTLLRKMAATIQASVTATLNLNVGSIMLAFLESVRDAALWLQGMILQLLTASRLSTSSGSDVDSFLADFGMSRLKAVPASGAITLARNTTTQQAIIPAATFSYINGVATWSGGTQVQTADGTQTFQVIPDTNQATYNAGLNAYVIPVGTGSITATVQAMNAGTQGNILAGTMTVLMQPIQGVQTVANASPYTNGVDAESDPAAKARFALYLSGLRAGIKAAVASAIAGLQQGIQYTLVEGYAYGGGAQPGYFYVVINPGTSRLQTAVYSAIDAIRPLGITFGVFAATTVSAAVTMTATAQAGYTHAQVAANITAAVQNYIAGIGLGNPLYWSELYAIAYSAAGVQEVTALTVNGGTADITATAQQVITAGTITVN